MFSSPTEVLGLHGPVTHCAKDIQEMREDLHVAIVTLKAMILPGALKYR